MKKFLRLLLKILIVIVPLYIFGCWYMARLLTNSYNTPVAYENQFPGEKVIDWNVVARDGQKISAWFIKKDSMKAVILLAGKGGDRLSMIERAKLYLDKGYSVVMPDLRGTGNSEAPYVTIGYNERYDLEACIDSLRKLGFKKIGVHGHSLGAATICYSLKEVKDYDFIVLESCYDNIDHAFEHRMDRLNLPQWLMFPVKKFAEWRLHISADKLYPEKYITAIKCPVLFLCGDREWQIPLKETEMMYDHCPSTTKYLYVFNGAEHQDFFNYSGEEYVHQIEHIVSDK